MQELYFVAQVGNGDIIPNINFTGGNAIGSIPDQELSGRIVLSFREAVNIMNENKLDMDTWVVRPKYSGIWKYPCYSM